jgi:hypothetical protein
MGNWPELDRIDRIVKTCKNYDKLINFFWFLWV